MTGGEELDEMDACSASLPASADWNGGLTGDQVAEFERHLRAALDSPPRYRWLYKGRWRRALPLPWHARLRLRLTHKRDGLAIWLCYRGHLAAAEALWRMTGARNARTRRRAT